MRGADAYTEQSFSVDGWRTSLRLVGQGFGRAKAIGGIRQVMVRGLARVDRVFVLNVIAYNLVRTRTLETPCPQTGQTA